ncbi:MAG: type VI secretion protein ImpB, partial [Alistipes sp.]|nr:type VI secretion protein ImpB [Alistipes sp.]
MSTRGKLPKYNALGLPAKWFGMADANSFYCSCEISQKPWLEDRAVIVASNSDKIAIALNRKAKALGFKLGDLLFEKVNEIRRHRIVIFPSNYELYGKISADLHTALASFVQDYEISSIDEGYLDFTGFDDYLDLYSYGRQIIDTIRYGKWIPISLGIAQTKTLAKAANKLAKRTDIDKKGFCLIATEQDRIDALKSLPLEDVWGVGRRFYRRIADDLRRLDKLTAWDFASMYPKRVRKLLGVTGERTWMELNGIECFDFEFEPEDKDRIMT